MICELDCFKTLLKHTRVPNKFKRSIRKSKLTTFIYPNMKSFRVVDSNHKHYNFLRKFEIMYSTSANITSKHFDKDWAMENADIIIEDKSGFVEGKSSSMFKLYRNKIKRIR
jgi:hypothetical protein